jgi:aryl-alcohol dehydrogenase
MARKLGATHVIDATEGEVASKLRELTGGRGLDYAFSTTGNPASLRDAVEALDFMGTAAFVSGGGEATIPTSTLLWGRTLRGVVQGDSAPRTSIPLLVELWKQGRFPFDRLITTYRFEEINEAAAASLSGEAIKPVLLFS